VIIVEAIVSPGIVRCEKNAQLTIITVEIKLRLVPFSQENTKTSNGHLVTRGAMQHWKNIAG